MLNSHGPGSPRFMKMIGSPVQRPVMSTNGSRLLFRLKQAQLSETVRGLDPIAYDHTR